MEEHRITYTVDEAIDALENYQVAHGLSNAELAAKSDQMPSLVHHLKTRTLPQKERFSAVKLLCSGLAKAKGGHLHHGSVLELIMGYRKPIASLKELPPDNIEISGDSAAAKKLFDQETASPSQSVRISRPPLTADAWVTDALTTIRKHLKHSGVLWSEVLGRNGVVMRVENNRGKYTGTDVMKLANYLGLESEDYNYIRERLLSQAKQIREEARTTKVEPAPKTRSVTGRSPNQPRDNTLIPEEDRADFINSIKIVQLYEGIKAPELVQRLGNDLLGLRRLQNFRVDSDIFQEDVNIIAQYMKVPPTVAAIAAKAREMAEGMYPLADTIQAFRLVNEAARETGGELKHADMPPYMRAFINGKKADPSYQELNQWAQQLKFDTVKDLMAEVKSKHPEPLITEEVKNQGWYQKLKGFSTGIERDKLASDFKGR